MSMSKKIKVKTLKEKVDNVETAEEIDVADTNEDDSIVPIKEFMDEFPELIKWMNKRKCYDSLDKLSVIRKRSGEGYRIEFHSLLYQYSISVVKPSKKRDKGYLGCIMRCRRSRIGEDWTRGNDFPDGSYSKKTWNHIIQTIAFHEFETK